MLKKYLYVGLLLTVFVIGAYSWKIVNTGRYAISDSEQQERPSFPVKATLVYVGNEAINSEDLEWEYKLYTKEIFDETELTPIPEVGNKVHEYLMPLKERLMGEIIERKLLYEFVKQDADFNLADPARYTNCLKEWQELTAELKDLVVTPQDKNRLKTRLCEQSVLLQYLEERVYPKITVKEDEMLSYFEKNKNEFSSPPKVVIRQIVLSTEEEAKKVNHLVRRDNFAELAKQYSITPESEQGGLVGPFAMNEMPHSFDVAFHMATGETKGILKSTYGFHIIRVEKKIPKVSLGYREAKPRIEEILKAKKRHEEYQKWVELAINAIQVKTPNPLW